MKESTLKKILGDPAFDPAVFALPAIQQYVSHHAVEVAKDAVAIKHLVKDETIISNIIQVLDPNNLDMIEEAFETASKANNWTRNEALRHLISLLASTDESNSDKVFEILRSNADRFERLSRPSVLPTLDHIVPKDKLFLLTKAALKQAGMEGSSVNGWTYGDWEVTVQHKEGVEAFCAALTANNISLQLGRDNTSYFRLISTLCQQHQDDPLGRLILRTCEEKWETFVCFSCGRGSGIDRNGRSAKSTNIIASPSGFTLHQKICYESDKYPSPWKIINGVERSLKFKCEGCGVRFTSKSGLTLHQKKCL